MTSEAVQQVAGILYPSKTHFSLMTQVYVTSLLYNYQTASRDPAWAHGL